MHLEKIESRLKNILGAVVEFPKLWHHLGAVAKLRYWDISSIFIFIMYPFGLFVTIKLEFLQLFLRPHVMVATLSTALEGSTARSQTEGNTAHARSILHPVGMVRPAAEQVLMHRKISFYRIFLETKYPS